MQGELTLKTLQEIINILELHKEEISRTFKLKEIGLFGSVVRSEQKETSDIDILIELAKPIGLLETNSERIPCLLAAGLASEYKKQFLTLRYPAILPPQGSSFVGLRNYLSDILGVRVDLVMKRALKPRIGKRILKEVLYV